VGPLGSVWQHFRVIHREPRGDRELRGLPPTPLPPGGGAKALILDAIVLIVSSSPLKRKEMDRKVVKNKRLAEM